MIELPLAFETPDRLRGASWNEIESLYPGDRIRQVERASIRAFVEKHRSYLSGRVLDFGAGKPGTCLVPQPYRDLVNGQYFPYEAGDELYPTRPRFDAVLCTQVLQYIRSPSDVVGIFAEDLDPGGHLVMTYPTCWADEDSDLWRFTRAGMEQIVKSARLEIVAHELRATVDFGNFKFPLGYGIVARK